MRTSSTRQKHLALSKSLYSKSIMYKCQRKLILKQAIQNVGDHNKLVTEMTKKKNCC